jgi:hypothetical protein
VINLRNYLFTSASRIGSNSQQLFTRPIVNFSLTGAISSPTKRLSEEVIAANGSIWLSGKSQGTSNPIGRIKGLLVHQCQNSDLTARFTICPVAPRRMGLRLPVEHTGTIVEHPASCHYILPIAPQAWMNVFCRHAFRIEEPNAQSLVVFHQSFDKTEMYELIGIDPQHNTDMARPRHFLLHGEIESLWPGKSRIAVASGMVQKPLLITPRQLKFLQRLSFTINFIECRIHLAFEGAGSANFLLEINATFWSRT